MDAVSSLHRSDALPVAKSAPDSRWRAAWWTSLGLIITAWLLVFNQQRLEWSVNPTYAYGWAVPLLAGYLFYERWRSRPTGVGPKLNLLWLIFPAILLLAYLPVRIVQEANPDWVKINWIMAGLAIGVSLSAIFAVSGVKGTLYCAFPVLFCLTALPWPVWMEDQLTKSLMQWNATAGAEFLTMLGHPALARGNLILIGSSWVNVEEACSGIRSLQTAFMVSLFFGEFFRMGWILRAVLMLGSFVIAFILNFARTVTLTYLGGQGGPEAVDKWHDTVGNIGMVLCLAGLWLLAETLQRRGKAPSVVRQTPPGVAQLRAPFPTMFAVVGIAWLGGSEMATAAWYAYHERGAASSVVWDLNWPTSMPQFRTSKLGERSQALLKYNEGHLSSWRTEEGFAWQMYYLRWLPGRVSKFLAGGHYPTVCLPASGLRLVSETGPFVCHVGPLSIPFITYLFDDGGRDVYVFHAILEDNQASYGERIVYRQAKQEERIASVLRGERNLGQRVLGVAVRGPFDAEEAQATLQQTLQELITTSSSTVSGNLQPAPL